MGNAWYIIMGMIGATVMAITVALVEGDVKALIRWIRSKSKKDKHN